MTKGGKRSNQELRTRKDLLLAGARLLKAGSVPSMDAVAREALVSRATAYRYFPSVDALLVEAPLDEALGPVDENYRPTSKEDPETRIDEAEELMHRMTFGNEAQLRMLLAKSVVRPTAERGNDDAPRRQNRRSELIDAALAPARKRFGKKNYEKLRAALSLIFGTESMIVFRDVIRLDEKTARQVKSWAVRALVRAALEEST